MQNQKEADDNIEAILREEFYLWFEANTFEHRILLLEEALEQYSTAPEIRIRLGHRLLIDGQLERAFSVISPVLADHRTASADLLAIAAHIEARRRNLSVALDYLAAFQGIVHKRSFELHMLRGDIFVFAGRYAEALAAYRELHPEHNVLESFISQFGIAWTYYRAGKLEQAIVALSQGADRWVRSDHNLHSMLMEHWFYYFPSLQELGSVFLERDDAQALVTPEQQGVIKFLLYRYRSFFSRAPSPELLLEAAALTSHPSLGNTLAEYYASVGDWELAVTTHLLHEVWQSEKLCREDIDLSPGRRRVYEYHLPFDSTLQVPPEQQRAVTMAVIDIMGKKQGFEYTIYRPFYRLFLRQNLIDGKLFVFMEIIIKMLGGFFLPDSPEYHDGIFAFKQLGREIEARLLEQELKTQLDGSKTARKQRETSSSTNLSGAGQQSIQEEHGPLNNGLWSGTKIIEHDGLRFRSQTEVRMYNALKRREILFIPNGLAVFGPHGTKREPDFLICKDNKWGILEVMSDQTHPSATKDHERARLFKEYGIRCIEFFDAKQCWDDPDKVIDQFLRLLDQQL